MAMLHFVKDGKTEAGIHETLSFRVDIERVIKTIHPPKPIWSKTPPLFDGNRIVQGTESYRHVIPEVEEAEAIAPFDRSGFFILDMSTQEVASRLGHTIENAAKS